MQTIILVLLCVLGVLFTYIAILDTLCLLALNKRLKAFNKWYKKHEEDIKEITEVLK